MNFWVAPAKLIDYRSRLETEGFVRDFEVEVRAKGQPHLLTFALDMTERKRAEAELQNALERERELSQLKSDFVSLVSHEFRTPLEIILSSANNLQRYHERLAPEKRDVLIH